MFNPFSAFHSIADRIRLRWASHYTRVTGKPPESGFSYTLFDSISHVPHDVWNAVNESGDVFLSPAYLSALEQAPPENMSFRYAVIGGENVPVGIAYFQIAELNYRLHKSPFLLLRAEKKTFFQGIHDKIADTASLRLLICGNALVSGEHGFSMPTLSNDAALQVIAEIAYALRKASNPRITVTLIKDFYKRKEAPAGVLSRFGYHAFDAGPNLVIPIRKNWAGFDDYLNDMKPKYRKRAVSAIKKGSAIRRQSLGLEEIVGYREELFSLYCRVSDRAAFKIFFLSPDYYIELKRRLGDKFSCDGYFSNSRLVGFTTRIFNGDAVEGYSHGVLYERNKEFELYQNYLLDDVRAAIASHSLYVNTGRTSAAMKSSVGAIGKDMVCYLRFSGGHSNQFVRPLFYFIKPPSEQYRNPFEE